ncbi:MAG: hypothetical protein DWI25_04715 [Planctomycetota bacterium]|nr:MAG: hypothetical protein DWI25_04715 [Planctomycetota bacterium]
MIQPVKFACAFLLGMLSLMALASGVRGADAPAIRASIKKASQFLTEQGQAADGSFSSQVGPAVTALAVTALAQSGTPVDAPVLQKGVGYLLKFKQADGGIHPTDSPVANYETSIAMLALSACNKAGRYDKDIQGAEAFVKGLQWNEGEGPGPSDPAYGGAGYGKKNRPDLSNTSFLIEALRSVGNGADDPAIARALIFVSRSQNLEGPNNTLPFAAKNPDGGFYYTPAAGGESQAGTTPEGGLRSYASMTYAGLKSMIFAGLSPDDPRVKAAISWLGKHYTFKENPGMGDAGLFYYFHTAAKALDVLGEDSFTDAEGIVHNWRSELADAILAKQQPDGSWINTNPRWMEGDPNLVTGYALLALTYCSPR